jgi:hypothetical protein
MSDFFLSITAAMLMLLFLSFVAFKDRLFEEGIKCTDTTTSSVKIAAP